MKKVFLLSILVLSCCYMNAQTKNTSVKRSKTSVGTKLSDFEAAQAKAEAEAKAEVEAEIKARNEKNRNCYFSFETGEFISKQGTGDYVVYEIPNMSASELKSAVYTTLSSMYNSPKDAITNLSDNMIQIEGYKENIYYFVAGSDIYFNDISFNMVIQFKDGKVRYNRPTIKMLYIGGPIGKGKANMALGIPYLIKKEKDRKSVDLYFGDLLRRLNDNLQKSNDW